MSNSIRVLLADDHPLIRAGISATLLAEPHIEIVGEATDGYQAQQMGSEFQPDVLLLDLSMPGPPALETIAYMRANCAATRVLVLTAYDDDAYVRNMVSAGVAGYMLKDEVSLTVVRAIRTVVQGDPWFSRAIVEKLARIQQAKPAAEVIRSLTSRELAVLQLVVVGRTNQDIGVVLGTSEKTVERQLKEVFMKLGVATRVEAAVWAVRVGLA